METLSARLLEKMILDPQQSQHDIDHLMKVMTYARLIADREHLDAPAAAVLEAAAVVHDISCPVLRKDSGSAPGWLQEKESRKLLETFLPSDLDPQVAERIIWLVSHHHSWNTVCSMDHQILMEADYLVNAAESGYPVEAIRNTGIRYFRTETGKRLLQALIER